MKASLKRNRQRGTVYHIEGTNWVQDGKALCGADISRPAFFASSTEDVEALGHKVCQRCMQRKVDAEFGDAMQNPPPAGMTVGTITLSHTTDEDGVPVAETLAQESNRIAAELAESAAKLEEDRDDQFTPYNLAAHQLCNAGNIAAIISQLEEGTGTGLQEGIRFLNQLNNQADKIEAALDLVEAGVPVGTTGVPVKDVQQRAKDEMVIRPPITQG